MLVHDMRFALAIMSRFAAQRTLFGPPPELVVVRQGARALIQRVTHHHSALHLALRLATMVLGWPRGTGRVWPFARVELKPQIAPRAEARVVPTTVPLAMAPVAPLPLLLPQLFRGHEGNERQGIPSHAAVGSPRPQVASPRQSLLAGLEPLRRVLRGSHAGESERRPTPASVTESRWDVRTEMKMRDRASRAAEPAIDLNGLTDRVIQAIDRRIIAQRERRGRP